MAIAQERGGRIDSSLESVCRAREGEVPNLLRKRLQNHILAILKYIVPNQHNEEKEKKNKTKTTKPMKRNRCDHCSEAFLKLDDIQR